MNKLTAREVAAAKEDGRYSDGGGLYLRVNGNRRRWIFRFTRGGKVTEVGLGARGPLLSLKAARQKAKELREQLALGVNPLAARRARAAAQEGRKTFAEVAAVVIERECKRWSASSLFAWERSLNVEAKRLGDLNIDEIAVEDVKRTVIPIFDRGDHVAARRTLSRIEAVLSCALAHGWRSSANVAAWEVFKHIAPKRENADRRHPMIPWGEAPAAFAKLREDDTMAARCIEFVALTGVRLSEASKATWSEVDFEAKTWTVPVERMKTRNKIREPHVVPLSSAAIELLKRLHEISTGAQLFPGRGTDYVSRDATWQASLKATDGKASPHGWRSTFRSWCGDNGVAREVAESALAHKLGGVEGAYNRAAMVERRRPVMQNWADYLSGATVVPFRGIIASPR